MNDKEKIRTLANALRLMLNNTSNWSGRHGVIDWVRTEANIALVTAGQTPVDLDVNTMLKTRYWQAFIDDKLGNDLFITDPERADRIHEYAKDGIDGSTHQEHIQDWRDCLASMQVVDPDEGEITVDLDEGIITPEAYDAIADDIDAAERFHEFQGTLHQTGA